MICFWSQGVDGFVICAGLTSQYCLLNYESGQFTDLFPIDTDNTMPIVKRISKVSQNEHCHSTRPRGYKDFFMLNSTKHEIYPAHKC